MAFVFHRERSALQNLNFWVSEKENKFPVEDRSFDLSITYSDDSTIKDRDLKLYDLYKSSFYTDVVLKVQDESLNVHGIVLSSISDYFQVMLQSGFRESSTRIIDFSTSFQEMAVLKNVVDYMYIGKVILRQPILEQVLSAAHLFMLNELKEHCAQFLLEQLKPQNALWTWRLAYLYGMTKLEVVCLTFLLSVFSRHLIDDTDMRTFTPDCLSALLNRHELIQNVHPRDVAYLIVNWLKAGDYEDRKELAKNLLLKYLKDQALDVILESIYSLSSYSSDTTSCELSPTIPNFIGKISWSSSQETEQGTPPVSPLHLQTHNGLLVREISCDGLSFFCPENDQWSYETIHNIGRTPIGIIESCYLVSIGKDANTIYLTNLKTKTVQAPMPLLRMVMRDLRLTNPHKEATHYFIHLGRLYALMYLSVRSTCDLIFSIYQFDVVHNWTLLFEIPQQLDNFFPESFSIEDICVKLSSVPLDNDNILFTARISLENNPNFCSRNNNGLNNTYSDVQTYRKSTCFLYKINPLKEIHTLLSAANMYLSDTQLDNAFFFKEKLSFPEQKIKKWTLFEDLKIQCISYNLSSPGWCQEDLTLPSPNIEPLPLKHEDFPRSCVKMHDSFVYAGIHLAPHVFNVYLFDLEKFEWRKLPPIPSTSTSKMALYPISASRPVNTFFSNRTLDKRVDNSRYFFLNTLLESWKGDRVK